MQLQVQHFSQPGTERRVIDEIKSNVNEIFSKVMKIEGLLCISCTRETVATANLRTLDSAVTNNGGPFAYIALEGGWVPSSIDG